MRELKLSPVVLVIYRWPTMTEAQFEGFYFKIQMCIYGKTLQLQEKQERQNKIRGREAQNKNNSNKATATQEKECLSRTSPDIPQK
ncbi:hypothetical protein Y1Q_0018313 [Alligator mississippiensis]|uniref:Uncharacterized protein n=1 Tax=Alligator mississippiensis TaxID=8496 RepID=A0A151PBU0_ALLMI|nr:hypothetical protein Y1Q_0018313 [Alligator mississippiensis]